MNLKKNEAEEKSTRRFRLHEILIALIKQQKDLELMELMNLHIILKLEVVK